MGRRYNGGRVGTTREQQMQTNQDLIKYTNKCARAWIMVVMKMLFILLSSIIKFRLSKCGSPSICRAYSLNLPNLVYDHQYIQYNF